MKFVIVFMLIVAIVCALPVDQNQEVENFQLSLVDLETGKMDDKNIDVLRSKRGGGGGRGGYGRCGGYGGSGGVPSPSGSVPSGSV